MCQIIVMFVIMVYATHMLSYVLNATIMRYDHPEMKAILLMFTFITIRTTNIFLRIMQQILVYLCD